MVVKQRTKQNLHEIRHILSAFEFNKSWDYTTVLQKIKDGFKEKIPPDVRYESLSIKNMNLLVDIFNL